MFFRKRFQLHVLIDLNSFCGDLKGKYGCFGIFISLKEKGLQEIYKQMQHYGLNQLEEYLYKWSLSDTISCPSPTYLYNNPGFQKTNHYAPSTQHLISSSNFSAGFSHACQLPSSLFNNWVYSQCLANKHSYEQTHERVKSKFLYRSFCQEGFSAHTPGKGHR